MKTGSLTIKNTIAEKQLLSKVAAHIKGKILFPEKLADAKKSFISIRSFPADFRSI